MACEKARVNGFVAGLIRWVSNGARVQWSIDPIPDRPDEFYGYLFWNKKYLVNGRSYETWYCTGNGGNKIFVFKDQPLVIVITASAYGQPYAHPQVDKMMTDYILPAVVGKK